MRLSNGRVKFELYLEPGLDDVIIEHLEPLANSHRLQAELRKLLSLAIEGKETVIEIKAPTRAKLPVPQASSTEASTNEAGASMRNLFGKPKVEG